MTVAIEIRLDDLRATPVLDRAIAAADDTTPLMDAIGAVLVSGTVRRFSTETAPDGTAWKPSLRATEEGGQTLTDQGYLRDSITHEVVAPDAVRVGSNLIYAGIHQTGGVIRPVNAPALRFRLATGAFATVQKVTMPARPYLGVDDEDAANIEEQGVLFLEGLFDGPAPSGSGGATP